MKILIVTHYYKHKNAMASLRPIKLAKYFAIEGHNVTVLTSKQKDNWCKQELSPEPSNDITEIYAEEYWGMKFLRLLYGFMQKRGETKRRKAQNDNAESTASVPSHGITVEAQKTSFRKRLKSWLSWYYYFICDRLENYFLYKGMVKAAKQERLANFDYVIATYPGAGVHKTGVWIKKHRRAKRFIADYRDPAYSPGGRSRRAEIEHDKKIQDMAVYAADTIVCVSEGMAESFAPQYKGEQIAPIFVVRNGFDPSDHECSVSSGLDTETFNFVYTGALYHGKRTVDMLAKVLYELNQEEETNNLEKVKIHYAGPDFPELINQLRPYGLEQMAVDHGYVSRQQSLAMQHDADVVLLLNWNQDNYTGVIPGKIYEYMASHKTICALIMGNQGGSETANMIRKDGLGCACEQAVPQDLNSLKLYIRNMLKAYAEGRRVCIESDGIAKYEYCNIAKQYLDVLARTK